MFSLVLLALFVGSACHAWADPEDSVEKLPRHLWAHSSDEMDYARLKGQRVGVVGAGASAMDSVARSLYML